RPFQTSQSTPSTYRVAVTITARKSTLPWQTAWYDAEPTVRHRVTSRTSSGEERRETGCREAGPLERAGDRGRTGDVQLTRIAERRLTRRRGTWVNSVTPRRPESPPRCRWLGSLPIHRQDDTDVRRVFAAPVTRARSTCSQCRRARGRLQG